LNVVIAHAGPGLASDDAIRLAQTEPNVYLEFCTTSPVRDVIRAATQQAGVDKILFGSDQLLIDPGYVLGAYQDARLTETEWHAVAQANPHRVFDL
jgi:predicted TIM-barrel fold metal-dependent hydrolase